MRYEMFDELVHELRSITLAITNLHCEVAKTNYKLDQVLSKMEPKTKIPQYDERGFIIGYSDNEEEKS